MILDWLTYRLSDLLMFSERVYWRLFALENSEQWPLPIVAPVAVLAALLLLTGSPRTGQRVLCGLLALACLWVGWKFVWHQYATVNWTMTFFAPLFAFSSFALALGIILEPATGRISGTSRLLGYGLVLYGALAYPFLAPLQGRGLSSAEVVGIAPDPTIIASLGAAVLMARRWPYIALLLISVAWLGQSTATLFVLDAPAALAPGIALAAGLLGIRPSVSSP